MSNCEGAVTQETGACYGEMMSRYRPVILRAFADDDVTEIYVNLQAGMVRFDTRSGAESLTPCGRPRRESGSDAKADDSPRPFDRWIVPSRGWDSLVSLGGRLRELAERLPPGASLSLTREGLLELAAMEEDRPDQPEAQGDLTIAELAARFHRSASTIRGWCERGRFDGAYKLNERDWRISQAAVDGFLARQRDGHRTDASLGSWRRLRAKTAT